MHRRTHFWALIKALSTHLDGGTLCYYLIFIFRGEHTGVGTKNMLNDTTSKVLGYFGMINVAPLFLFFSFFKLKETLLFPLFAKRILSLYFQ